MATPGTDVESNWQHLVPTCLAFTGAVAFIVGPVLGTLAYGWMWESPCVISGVVLGFTALFAYLSPRMKELRRITKGLQ